MSGVCGKSSNRANKARSADDGIQIISGSSAVWSGFLQRSFQNGVSAETSSDVQSLSNRGRPGVLAGLFQKQTGLYGTFMATGSPHSSPRPRRIDRNDPIFPAKYALLQTVNGLSKNHALFQLSASFLLSNPCANDAPIAPRRLPDFVDYRRSIRYPIHGYDCLA